MIEIRIPLQAPSQNDFSAYRDWRARSRATRSIRMAWASACRVLMAAKGIPKAVGPRRLHVIAYRKQKCRDIANLSGGLKPAIDGLVDAGLLIDDADELARITYAQGVRSESPTRDVLTIIQVENIDSQPSQILGSSRSLP